MFVNIIGAGLAGCEATYQLVKRGIPVKLYEMKPKKYSPAHKSENFAELVCSNSLRSNSLNNAVGILKEEMRLLDSLIIKSAYENAVPAGSSLAVDRNGFSTYITDFIKNNPLVEVISEEVTEILDGYTIIATGPLTSDALSKSIKEFLGDSYLSFYDAAAPLIIKDSINLQKIYLKSRYDRGEAAYYNCPMDEKAYKNFYQELIHAKIVIVKDFEKNVFEGCMPIEVMAKRGFKTMLYGPLKPVGLEKDDSVPYAVVQLRQDDRKGELLNMVGFQTNLKFAEQKRVFRLIPGLEKAEFARYGVMHKNTYINSPKSLCPTYQSRKRANLFFAGQLTGVEGYVESAASGLLAGLNMSLLLKQKELLALDDKTIIGSMANYISDVRVKNFQPMNANFSLLQSLPKHDKKDRKRLYYERSKEEIERLKQQIN